MLGKMAVALTEINQVANPKTQEWVLQVAGLTGKVVNLITNYYATISNADFQRVGYIRSVLDKAFPGSFTNMPLSQAAINAVRSIEGASSVLIGARSVEYVDDVLLALQRNTPVYDRADWLGMKLH